MASLVLERIVSEIKALPPDMQLELAQVIDRLTWARRWRAVCERIARRAAKHPRIGEETVDDAVRQVRAEKPLSERSSTPPF